MTCVLDAGFHGECVRWSARLRDAGDVPEFSKFCADHNVRVKRQSGDATTPCTPNMWEMVGFPVVGALLVVVLLVQVSICRYIDVNL